MTPCKELARSLGALWRKAGGRSAGWQFSKSLLCFPSAKRPAGFSWLQWCSDWKWLSPICIGMMLVVLVVVLVSTSLCYYHLLLTINSLPLVPLQIYQSSLHPTSTVAAGVQQRMVRMWYVSSKSTFQTLSCRKVLCSYYPMSEPLPWEFIQLRSNLILHFNTWRSNAVFLQVSFWPGLKYFRIKFGGWSPVRHENNHSQKFAQQCLDLASAIASAYGASYDRAVQYLRDTSLFIW